MTIYEFRTTIESTGLPCAYYAFRTDNAPPLPFITWFQPRSENFSADNIVYHESPEISVELYTETRDPDTESAVEAVLTAAGLFFTKEIGFIEDENTYQIAYSLNL